MKLVAGLMVGNGEALRYLPVTLPALLEFCDQVVVLDESTDGSGDLAEEAGAIVERVEPGTFFAHEGRARQLLQDVVLEAGATHVLAIDADELVTDGAAVRRALEQPGDAWCLVMEEVWEACDDRLCIREDGGWRSHPIACLWRVPPSIGAGYRIRDAALACGRVPAAVEALDRQGAAIETGASVLHFGWANRAERQARYDRYVTHDGGRFHASAHLQSIMWPDDQVTCRSRPWPAALEPARAELVARARQ